MANEFLILSGGEIKKQELHFSESTIALGDANVNKTIMPDEFTYFKRSSKYFAGYKKKRNCTVAWLAPKN